MRTSEQKKQERQQLRRSEPRHFLPVVISSHQKRLELYRFVSITLSSVPPTACYAEDYIRAATEGQTMICLFRARLRATWAQILALRRGWGVRWESTWSHKVILYLAIELGSIITKSCSMFTRHSDGWRNIGREDISRALLLYCAMQGSDQQCMSPATSCSILQ